MADDIAAQVNGWVADEIDKQRFGEEYGFAVTWAPTPVQGPAGTVMVPGWLAMITCRNPLLGQGDLFHLAPLGLTRRQEKQVREQAADGIRQLRDLAASKLAGQNGHKALAP